MAVLLLTPFAAAAQNIDTNRPGFSFTPGVVDAGRVQIETGLTYTRIDDDADVLSLPAAEIRFGVAERLELFVSGLDWLDTDFGGDDVSGFADPAVGAKLAVSRPGARTAAALLFQTSVPIGDDELSSDHWNPAVGFIWAYDGSVPLAGTARLGDTQSGWQLDNSLKLPFFSRGMQSAFVEWEANIPENGGPAHWLNGGYQWLLDGDTQLDFSAGAGLNDRAGDYRLGIGFSLRL